MWVHRKRVVWTGRSGVVFLPFYKARVTWRYKILSYLLDYYSRHSCFYLYSFSIISYPHQLLHKIYLFFLYLLDLTRYIKEYNKRNHKKYLILDDGNNYLLFLSYLISLPFLLFFIILDISLTQLNSLIYYFYWSENIKKKLTESAQFVFFFPFKKRGKSLAINYHSWLGMEMRVHGTLPSPTRHSFMLRPKGL